MEVMQLVVLFGAVLLGGLLGLRSNVVNKIYLKSALTFSASFILGITVLHLMPIVFADFQFQVGIWVLLGFFIQIFLESLSSGVEHGHIHSKSSASKTWATQILIGLSFHAFIEGMPLLDMGDFSATQNHTHQSGEWTYFFSLIFHKLPAAYALVMLLKHSGFQKNFILSCLLIFALMTPLGALLVNTLSIDVLTYKHLLAFVIGAFLHISTTIMFESDAGTHHHLSWPKISFSVLGIGMAILAEML